MLKGNAIKVKCQVQFSGCIHAFLLALSVSSFVSSRRRSHKSVREVGLKVRGSLLVHLYLARGNTHGT